MACYEGRARELQLRAADVGETYAGQDVRAAAEAVFCVRLLVLWLFPVRVFGRGEGRQYGLVTRARGRRHDAGLKRLVTALLAHAEVLRHKDVGARVHQEEHDYHAREPPASPRVQFFA